jgi:ribonuclease BN (tRNA processing enzyme)
MNHDSGQKTMNGTRLSPILLIAPLVAAGWNQGGGPPGTSAGVPPGDVQAVQSEVTQVVLLGTGTPNAEPGRYGSSVAVVVRGTPYLFDAGAGVVHRANQAHRERGIEGLAPSRLATVFLTHLHTDHTVGLPDLIFTPWVLERRVPLRIFGPEGTEAMAGHLQKAYQRDVQIRLEGMEPANESGYRVVATDTEPGVVYRDEQVEITAFPVDHGDWAQAFGYRVRTPDRVVVISGDTRPTESVVEQCDGCDILIHEVYSRAGWERRSPEWQRYHAAFHTSGPELGRIAARAGPGLLVLTHQLLWGSTPEELLAEVRSAFQGPVVYGNDLDVF